MERKLKILKAVLLLRRINRYQGREEQIAGAENIIQASSLMNGLRL